jgi:type IV secretory pathway TrbD component
MTFIRLVPALFGLAVLAVAAWLVDKVAGTGPSIRLPW